jgi:hypothetical protein
VACLLLPCCKGCLVIVVQRQQQTLVSLQLSLSLV